MGGKRTAADVEIADDKINARCRGDLMHKGAGVVREAVADGEYFDGHVEKPP